MKRLLLFALIMMSITAFSQVEKGDINAQANVTYLSIDGAGAGVMFLKGGYYATQQVEAGASIQFIFADGANGVGVGPYVTYNFLTADAKLLPYIGGQLSFMSIGDVDINSGGVYGGAKYFLTEAVNVDAGLALQQGFGDFDGTLVTFTLGIGIVLGKMF
jgi:hypothetical protein